MEDQVSVILCAYTEERWELLLEAVASLQVQKLPPAEIILVVDHNPALLERARRELPGLTVIANQGSQGLSGARNSGLAAAHGQIIAFIDEDAAAAPDWLARLVDRYRDEDVLGVGGSIQPIWSAGKPAWFPEEFLWVVGCTYRGLPTATQPIRNLIGCNMSFRRHAFTLAGTFREGIGRIGKRPLGCEETELCIRMLQQPGSTLLYEPSARVEHHVSPERSRLRYFLSRCYAEGLSKALVSSLVGRKRGLASERKYTLRTLPAGMWAGLRDALHGDPWGLARMAAILAGLTCTSAGYLAGSLSMRSHQSPARAEKFEPRHVLEVELSQPLPEIQALKDGSGNAYQRALCLVRLHTRPLGFIPLDLHEGSLSATELAAQIRAELDLQTIAGLSGLSEPGVGGSPQESVTIATLSETETPFVSVVIATRDRPDSLRRTLDSLLRQEYSNFELLLVDNAPSSDATQLLIQENDLYASRVSYIREERAGLAIAHNRALEEAKGELIAFTDDDVVLDRHWLSSLVQAFQYDDQVACVTGMILPLEMETPSQGWIEQFGGFGKGYATCIFGGQGYKPPSPLYPYAAGTFGSGANMAFRTSLLRQIGGFDPALGAGTPAQGGDDLAAFFEVLARGYRLVYEPAAFLYHQHRPDYPGLRRQAYGYGVGLAAFLTRALLEKPVRVLSLASRLPAGLAYLLSPRSPKNSKKTGSYPQELTRLELKGFLYGPVAYLRSLRRWHRIESRISTKAGAATGSTPYPRVTDKISLQ